MSPTDKQLPPATSLVSAIIRFCLLNKMVVALLLLAVTGWGLMVAPFDFNLGDLPRDPVPVDAIPDIGENQQIVFTKWAGRSPQDMEDQVTYPLTVSLLGLPGRQDGAQLLHVRFLLSTLFLTTRWSSIGPDPGCW
ncbi:Cu(I)/Ag(I) efflux system membrane protein CusA/SilA, partial [Candidatus Electrothrix aarhusensis]